MFGQDGPHLSSLLDAQVLHDFPSSTVPPANALGVLGAFSSSPRASHLLMALAFPPPLRCPQPLEPHSGSVRSDVRTSLMPMSHGGPWRAEASDVEGTL